MDQCLSNNIETQKNVAMKTRIFIIATSLIFISSSIFAGNYSLLPEDNINDIPFNTAEVVKAYKQQQAMNTIFKLPEERFVDDIPFDTHEVAACYRSDSAMQVVFSLPDEDTINDFPFTLDDVFCNTPVFKAGINVDALQTY